RTTTRRPTSRGPESRTTAISCACEGARMKLSCGIRRSLLAVRTMRQMNRYSSTTNAILRMSRSSSTAIEATSMSASGLALEDELGRPDGDRVTGAQLRALQPSAVDLGSVRRVQVDHPVCGLGSRRFVRRGPRPTLRHPGRDSEFAHLQVLVGLHQHLRWGQQHVLLSAGVLREVLLELAEQRLFVVRELLAVGWRQVDRV